MEEDEGSWVARALLLGSRESWLCVSLSSLGQWEQWSCNDWVPWASRGVVRPHHTVQMLGLGTLHQLGRAQDECRGNPARLYACKPPSHKLLRPYKWAGRRAEKAQSDPCTSASRHLVGLQLRSWQGPRRPSLGADVPFFLSADGGPSGLGQVARSVCASESPDLPGGEGGGPASSCVELGLPVLSLCSYLHPFLYVFTSPSDCVAAMVSEMPSEHLCQVCIIRHCALRASSLWEQWSENSEIVMVVDPER